MKTVDRINHEKYTHVGISKNGTTHLGFWDDDKDRLVWVAAHSFQKCKNKQRRAELMRLVR